MVLRRAQHERLKEWLKLVSGIAAIRAREILVVRGKDERDQGYLR